MLDGLRYDNQRYVCITRPRRFGKTVMAQMTAAYMGKAVDSSPVFDRLAIAGKKCYQEHLNRYHVINLDITSFISEASRLNIPFSNVPNMITDAVYRELIESCPELDGKSLTDVMIAYVEKSGKEFVFIIDEWDALIREAKGGTAAQNKYLNFLRGWFKNSSFTPRVVAAAYMTGILPIKKDGSQSAISDFTEYPIRFSSIMNPRWQIGEIYVLLMQEAFYMITEKHHFTFPATYPLERLGHQGKLLFFDIETTGFSGDHSRLYLIGCVCATEEPGTAFNMDTTGQRTVTDTGTGTPAAEHLPVSRDSWQLVQWFANTVESEKEILISFLQFAKRFSVLVHFNGDRFDIPFIQKRCQCYGLEWDISKFESIDIYKKIRPYRKILGLDSLKQKSIEHFLGIFRQDMYSGGQLIEVYNDYLITREDRLYDMLMLHNREDLEGMPLILPILCYPDFLEGDFTLVDQQVLTRTDIFGEEDRSLRLAVRSRETVPVPVEWQAAEGHVEADFEIREQMLVLTVPLVQGALKYFYPNYKDYYYLPYEDRAIHKSVGTYVERQARRQATGKTCYTWKSGCFVLQPGELWSPAFRREYKDKQQYAEYLPDMFYDHEKLMEYLAWVMGRERAADQSVEKDIREQQIGVKKDIREQ